MSCMKDNKKTGESTPTCSSAATPSSTDTIDLDNPDLYPPFSTNGGLGSVPEPGGLYMIRELDSDRAIMLDGGHLTLQRGIGTGGGWQWHCTQDREGWLGFRERVSGKYLGRDGKGGFCAKASDFKSWEKFNIRPVKTGGYHILAIRWWTLLRMGIAGDSGALIEVSPTTNCARWEFVEL
ncbi:hypothetical protein F5Y19DRAFT_440802 [Xylariaceae sp. FL1651]|nr:hypothetical protein F5Y19DRAFT_440802 [Xylariaceae sp. FL1651]